MNVTPLYGESQANTARTLIGGQAIGENRNDLLRQVLVATANKVSGGGGAAWGAITGTLSAQTDLQTALDAKVNGTGGGSIATGGFTLTLPATGTAALRDTANTFTAAQTISVAGANSTPPLYLTGALNVAGNGTTTFPHIFHQPVGATAATNWRSGANDGTVFGANEVTGFVGNFLDLKIAGTSRFIVHHNGDIYLNNGTTASMHRRIDVDMLLLHQASGGSAMVGIGSSTHNPGINISRDLQLSWTSDSPASPRDVILGRKAAATLQLGLDAAGVTNQMFTAASRITSNGVGANLTIAPGNGRGGAGGSLILATYDTQGTGTIGNLQTRLTIDTTGLSTFSGNVNVTAGTRTGAALTLSQTWNNAGVTCRGIEFAVTNTNSAADSTIFRILGGAAGTSQLFSIDKNGWVNGPTGTTMVIAPAGGQNMNLYATGGGNITCNAVLDAQAGLSLADSRNITFATTNGTIIGTATNQKMGFWNATPVVRPAHIADPAGGAVVDAEARTAINAILAWQATLGLTAAA
jgi:hypothetical protein